MKRLAFALSIVASACAAPTEEGTAVFPADAVPSVRTLQLSVSPTYNPPGQPITLTVDGARPNQQVFFARLDTTGRACPRELGGQCTAGANPVLLGTVRANTAGIATLSFTPPAAITVGASFGVQAATVNPAPVLLTNGAIITLDGPVVCGDGVVQPGEICDDGNVLDDDGCSSSCAVETGFTCTGQTSVCVGICGDGLTVGLEECDDANTANGDCCSSQCQVEVAVGTDLCEIEPNDEASLATGPLMDGAGLYGDITPAADLDYASIELTTTADIRLETLSAGASLGCPFDTVLSLYDSSGTLLGTDNDDGIELCSLISGTVDAFAAGLPPGTYYARVQGFQGGGTILGYALRYTVLAACGDGVPEGTETCDDGNVQAGDGCSEACRVEPGFFCYGAPSLCGTGACGNGFVEGSETCDDGNASPGDGCDATCQVERDFTCEGQPSVCVATEQSCSDGLDNDSDGFIDAADRDCGLPAWAPSCGGGSARFVFRATGLPLTIPDSDPTGITSAVRTSAGGTLTRLAVLADVTHSFDGDLDMTLTAPDGSSYDLSSDNGAGGDNYAATMFGSSCTTPVTNGTAPFAGCFAPETPLTPLLGSSGTGTWRLQVVDDLGGDVGMLREFAVLMCVMP